MDAEVLRVRLRDRGLDGGLAWLLLPLTAVWSVVAAGAAAGAVTLPRAGIVRPALMLVPVGLLAAAVLGRRWATTPLRLSAAWSCLVAGALFAAVVLEREPAVGLVIPAAAVTALAASRFPAATVVLLFALTGIFGSLRQFTGLPVRETAEVMVAGLWIGAILSYFVGVRDRALSLWPGVVALASYVLLTLLYAPTGRSLSSAFTLRSATLYLTAVLLIGYAGWGPAVQRRIVRGVLVVAVLVGGYATLRWLIGPADAELALRTPRGDYTIVRGDNPELAAFAPFQTRHQLGTWTAALIPFCTALALALRGRLRRLAVAAAVLSGVGVLASQARVAAYSLVIGLLVVLALYELARAFPGRRLNVTGGAALLVVMTALVAFPLTVGKSETFREHYAAVLSPFDDRAVKGRFRKWNAALKDVRDHPFGQGLDSAAPRSLNPGNVTVGDIDNSYLKILYEQGVLGLALLVAALVLLFWGLASRAISTADRYQAAVAIGACGALASYAVSLATGLYINYLQSLAVWIVVGLGVAQFALADRGGTAGPK